MREIDAYTEPHFLPEAGGGFSDIKGEAVVVDLPDGKSLFGVLNAPRPEGAPTQMALDAFRHRFNRPYEPYKDMAQQLSQSKLKASLPPSAFPNFVIFGDTSNPATVLFVDRDHPERTLGDGIRVESVIIETTHDPITSIVEKRLPWLRNYTTTLGGKPYKNQDSASNELSRKDFIQP